MLIIIVLFFHRNDLEWQEKNIAISQSIAKCTNAHRIDDSGESEEQNEGKRDKRNNSKMKQKNCFSQSRKERRKKEKVAGLTLCGLAVLRESAFALIGFVPKVGVCTDYDVMPYCFLVCMSVE
ncbi:MAG TPA: hypothetical protein VEI57_13465 [Nitrospirota bacterium]|nr:hypothetical protein [Nitrospirota bacterium]